MAHDRHHWRARQKIGIGVDGAVETFFNVGFGDPLDAVAQLFRDQLRCVGVDHVGDLHHLALLHQFLDEIDSTHGHAGGEILHGDGFRDRHVAHDAVAAAALQAGLLFPFAGALDRSERTLPLFIVERIGDGQLTGPAARRFFRLAGGFAAIIAAALAFGFQAAAKLGQRIVRIGFRR